MELRIAELPKQLPIEFNFEELKTGIAEATKNYTGLVYTESQIKEAKQDRAKLNKLKQALDSKRKDVKKAVNEPYMAFEKQIKELTGMIDDVISGIDVQLDEYAEKRVEEKKKAIEEIFNLAKIGWNNSYKCPWVTLDKVMNDKWLNASCSESEITKEINALFERIDADLSALSAMDDLTLDLYKESLNLANAISRAQEIKRFVKPQEEKPIIKDEDASRNWVNISIYASYEEAAELRQWLEKRQIEFKAI